MTVTGYDVKGERYPLSMPVTLQITKETTAPADSLIALLPMESSLPELTAVEVYENTALLFRGCVDEQSLVCGRSGRIIKISARSLAAGLTDNEAIPRTYLNPYMSDIFSNHAKNHGIYGFLGANLRYSGSFVVDKGMSEWTAISRFCRRVYGITPRVTESGYLSLRGGAESVSFRFSGETPGTPYVEAEMIYRRHKAVSEVMTKEAGGEQYNFLIRNQPVLGRGISRRRVLAANGSSEAEKRELAEGVLMGSVEGSRALALTLSGTVEVPLKAAAAFSGPYFGPMENLRVAAVRHSLDTAGEFTRVELWPKDDFYN